MEDILYLFFYGNLQNTLYLQSCKIQYTQWSKMYIFPWNVVQWEYHVTENGNKSTSKSLTPLDLLKRVSFTVKRKTVTQQHRLLPQEGSMSTWNIKYKSVVQQIVHTYTQSVVCICTTISDKSSKLLQYFVCSENMCLNSKKKTVMTQNCTLITKNYEYCVQ